MAPYSRLKVNQRFGGIYNLNLQGGVSQKFIPNVKTGEKSPFPVRIGENMTFHCYYL
jgi:hypothetical protein